MGGTVNSNVIVQPPLSSAAVPVEEDYKVCLPGLDLCNYKLAAVVLIVICFLSIVFGVRYSYYASDGYKDQPDYDEARFMTATSPERWTAAGPTSRQQEPVQARLVSGPRINQV